jgi:regulator of replication initiation timing
LARNEDHEKELCELETKMHSLMMKNEELRRENESLKEELKGILLLNKLYPEGKF